MINITEVISKIDKAKQDILESSFDIGTIASILNIAVDGTQLIFETSNYNDTTYVIGGGYSTVFEGVILFLSDKVAKLNANKDNWTVFKRELRKTLKDELVCNENRTSYKHKYVGMSIANKGMLRDKPFMKSFALEIANDIEDKAIILEKVKRGDSIMLDTYLENFDKDSSVVKKLLTYTYVYIRLNEEAV